MLIYDKLRGARDVKERFLLTPVIEHVQHRGLNHYRCGMGIFLTCSTPISYRA